MKNNLSRLVPAILLSVSVFAGTTFAVGGAMGPAKEVNAVVGDNTTLCYKVSSKTAVTTDTGHDFAAESGISAAYSQTYGTVSQMTSGNSVTLTITGAENYKISSLELYMKSNASKGAGSLSYKTANGEETYVIGDASTGIKFNEANWNGGWTTSYVWVDVNKNNADKFSGVELTNEFTIKVKATANSLYVSGYRIGVEPIITASTHYVVFDTNGGNAIESKAFDEGAAINVSEIVPEKENYIFDGWYTNSDFSGDAFTTGTMGTSDITLYAKWIEDTRAKYTVSFKMNDGTENNYADSVVLRDGEKVSCPEGTPTYSGHIFLGWFEEGATEAYNFDSEVKKDLVLLAKWREFETYTKVTSPLDDWSGTYLIVNDTNSVCFNGALNADGLDTTYNNKPVSIVENTIQESQEILGAQFDIEKMEGGYSIKSQNGYYIGGVSGSNTIATSVNPLLNTLTFDDNNDCFEIISDGSYLKFNDTSTQMRFRYMKTGGTVTLYKLAAAVEPTIAGLEEFQAVETKVSLGLNFKVDSEGNYVEFSKLRLYFTFDFDYSKFANSEIQEAGIYFNLGETLTEITREQSKLVDNDMSGSFIAELNAPETLEEVKAMLSTKFSFASYVKINGEYKIGKVRTLSFEEILMEYADNTEYGVEINKIAESAYYYYAA